MPPIASLIIRYLQRKRPLLAAFAEQLRVLRAALESSEYFHTHQFIRTSVLLVYDQVSASIAPECL